MYVMSVTQTRCGWRELTVQHVGDYADRTTPIARLAAIAHFCPQTFALHEAMDAVTAARFARFTQIHRDLAVAIDAAAG